MDSTRLEQGAARGVADPEPACGEPVESVEQEPSRTRAVRASAPLDVPT